MTPRYHAIMDYWKDDPEHLALKHKVWDPTPWVIDIRSPYPDSSPASFRGGDVNRWMHTQWLRENFGPESWPIHDKPGDWYFASATVDGETWIGFRTEEMMRRFIAFFPQSIIEGSLTDAAMPSNSRMDGSARPQQCSDGDSPATKE